MLTEVSMLYSTMLRGLATVLLHQSFDILCSVKAEFDGKRDNERMIIDLDRVDLVNMNIFLAVSLLLS